MVEAGMGSQHWMRNPEPHPVMRFTFAQKRHYETKQSVHYTHGTVVWNQAV